MFTLVDVVLIAIIFSLLAILLTICAGESWSRLERKSADSLRQQLTSGSGS